ncbi:MAG: AHH domain-containing protein [Endozoicomonas sp.]|uniref:AHH domain-containing protein n=1 Tax=Endozoicomonas sp. TaxID=1892382 RepID=UPI003D9B1C69
MSLEKHYATPAFLEKVKSESISDADHEVFNRIERKFSAAKKARLMAKLEKFRGEAAKRDKLFLQAESHSSSLLGEFMRAVGMQRPGPRWEAHHIVSGDHKEATPARAVMAQDDIKMRIDDPSNGCWMPKTKKDARPTIYPNAIPHTRIHREKYYEWIFNMLMVVESFENVEAIFKTVRAQILHGNIKNELLLQEIHEAEYDAWSKIK